VEPTGFEPVTFPVLPGRAQQRFDESPIFLPLDVNLSLQRFRSSGVGFVVNKPPRTAVLEGFGIVGIMVRDSLSQIFRLADIETSAGFTSQDVNVESHKVHLVEPTGFEPVTSSMPSMRAPNCATAPLM
jgi:hypothetical protein